MSDLGCGGACLQRRVEEFEELILASQEAERCKRILESLAALSTAISEELPGGICISLRGLSGDATKMVHVHPDMTFAELRRSISEMLSLGPWVGLSLILSEHELREHPDELSLAAPRNLWRKLCCCHEYYTH